MCIWPKNNLFKGFDYEPLITWNKINATFPWSILLLAGGGLALAEGFKKSGLSELIGASLKNIIPPEREAGKSYLLIHTYRLTYLSYL